MLARPTKIGLINIVLKWGFICKIWSENLSSLIVTWLRACPYNSNLYWTDWNRDAPKIETSYMDGSNRRVLVKDDLGLPNGLTYDSESSLLCWADAGTVFRQMTHLWNGVCLVISNKCDLSPAGTHKMECMHPARGDRRKIMEGIQYPFGITSFGKNIYYTDWRRFGFLFSHEVYLVTQWQYYNTTFRAKIDWNPSILYVCMCKDITQPFIHVPCKNPDLSR